MSIGGRMTPQAFLAEIGPAAREAQRRTAIPASVSLAQAILESGWGRSQLAQQGKNLFGIKADKSWHGETLNMPTKEFIHNRWTVVDARWRKYATWQDSIEDHAAFFYANPRYQAALRCVRDYAAFARAVQICGYATAPHYAAKLLTIIDGRELTRFDAPESAWALRPEYAWRVA